ncbi:MAG TPA: hypothetical protein PKD55_01550 [Bellilinea sp.]|nr:hypothetical protein [Bellilinea sp.]
MALGINTRPNRWDSLSGLFSNAIGRATMNATVITTMRLPIFTFNFIAPFDPNKGPSQTKVDHPVVDMDMEHPWTSPYLHNRTVDGLNLTVFQIQPIEVVPPLDEGVVSHFIAARVDFH